MKVEDLPRLVDADTARRFDAFARSGAEPPGDAYYSVEGRRFELRADDVLLVAPDVTVRPAACGVRLESSRARAALDVCGIRAEEATRAVEALGGALGSENARVASGLSPETWRTFTDATFGMLLFSPHAMLALERRVPGVEIVRFAGSPYEIVRSYWENMGSVADAIRGELSSALESKETFIRFLRRLHVLALVGETGTSLYRPASPVAFRRGGAPGDLLFEGCVLEGEGEIRRFVSGPRVGAGTIGGEHYHALLSESLGEACSGESDASGRVVLARADGDAEAAPWFCPPRPLEEAHFQRLRDALSDALEGADPVLPLSRFHRGFVRLHPFPFANQSVAMSLVNHVLRTRLGAGIPHHVLDHLALRLPENAYERVFAVAVKAWLVVDENPVQRTFALVERKRRAFSLLAALGNEPSLEGARTLVRARPEDASLVFIRS